MPHSQNTEGNIEELALSTWAWPRVALQVIMRPIIQMVPIDDYVITQNTMSSNLLWGTEYGGRLTLTVRVSVK